MTEPENEWAASLGINKFAKRRKAELTAAMKRNDKRNAAAAMKAALPKDLPHVWSAPKRGRPTRDLLRGLDVNAIARDVCIAASAHADQLARFLGWRDIPKPRDIAACLLGNDVHWLYTCATGGDVAEDMADAESALDATAAMLAGVPLPKGYAMLLAAARARLAIDTGRAVTLDGLAALAGCPLSAVQRARLDGALGGRKSGRTVRVSAKAARAWLVSRGVT